MSYGVCKSKNVNIIHMESWTFHEVWLGEGERNRTWSAVILNAGEPGGTGLPHLP